MSGRNGRHRVRRRRHSPHRPPCAHRTQLWRDTVYQNATREQIITALQKGKSVNAIAAELRADRGRIRRIRDESGIPVHVPQYPTAEEKWQLYARPVEGGHREWTGPRASRGGTPVMRIGTTSHRPSGIAFRIRTGRDPVGQVKSECGLKHCVEPAHDDDEAGRREARAKLHPTRSPAGASTGMSGPSTDGSSRTAPHTAPVASTSTRTPPSTTARRSRRPSRRRRRSSSGSSSPTAGTSCGPGLPTAARCSPGRGRPSRPTGSRSVFTTAAIPRDR